jgi:hypothetical protein
MASPEVIEHCPMCGQALPHFDKSDPDALLRLLKLPADGSTTGPQERRVYRAADGRWFVTFGGGEWPERTVLELMARGEIRPVFNDPSMGVYNVIRTPLRAVS